MHQSKIVLLEFFEISIVIGSIEVLAPLRERFNVSHYALFKFYNECATIRYLTTLITIPTLTQNPPDLLEKGISTKQSKRVLPSTSPLDNVDINEQQRVTHYFISFTIN